MSLNITQKNYRQLFSHLKSSAKRRNISFELNQVEFYNITIPLRCPILGTVLVFNTGTVGDDSVSFDRKDSSKGYSFDNIVVVCNRVNRLKSDASIEELNKITEYYNELEKERILFN